MLRSLYESVSTGSSPAPYSCASRWRGVDGSSEAPRSSLGPRRGENRTAPPPGPGRPDPPGPPPPSRLPPGTRVHERRVENWAGAAGRPYRRRPRATRGRGRDGGGGEALGAGRGAGAGPRRRPRRGGGRDEGGRGAATVGVGGLALLTRSVLRRRRDPQAPRRRQRRGVRATHWGRAGAAGEGRGRGPTRRERRRRWKRTSRAPLSARPRALPSPRPLLPSTQVGGQGSTGPGGAGTGTAAGRSRRPETPKPAYPPVSTANPPSLRGPGEGRPRTETSRRSRRVGLAGSRGPRCGLTPYSVRVG